ncbi:helicase-associated domain-containing protein [Desulfosporosinus sp. PR]|uniref:helicase-associated domain-containing protein n=1 Tax=Candidatus Desulfosporosinus nitrosoreducens TaxID=3401928 RepID=UPI0027F24F4D|nr:helicase-associated domain-containing protein [Desulfosporosinus sp. PR]MDQ7093527.1 helicase-associated domain-containing protein [Desulfosporosinus sp. PR]
MKKQLPPADQPKTAKWRPVFGEKYPSGFKPPTQENQAEENLPQTKSGWSQTLDQNNQKTPPSESRAKTQRNEAPVTRLKPKAWPDYFAQMGPVERILFAYIAFLQPEDEGIEYFSAYNSESFRYLDKDLPGLSYQDSVRLLSKWAKIGFFSSGRYSQTYNLKEEAAQAFWRFIDKQADSGLFDLEPQQLFCADLSSTLDNLFNVLVLIEQGEVLVTRAHEINKHSLKRVLAALSKPAGADESFDPESYFFWILGIAKIFHLFMLRGDRLALTKEGRVLPETIKVENFLSELCTVHVYSLKNKGLFLLLPVLSRCTTWTSWGHTISTLISDENVCNLLILETVISFLNPMRYLGLLEWGKYENDILVRVTALGQLAISKLYQDKNLEGCKAEIKTVTDQVYPMSGPNTAYVQPNFEILLPRSASWHVRWELSRFAVLEQQDQMLRFRLDKTYLMNALKRGLPADEVVSALKKLSTYPLPENLVLTLQQWLESFGQVKFLQLSLLECSSPEQAASIASSRKYREYVLGLYNSTTVIVREIEKLRRLLEKQGIYPSPGILDGESVANRQLESKSP